MKKIFAFILASIMVLSLVPASAFAAVTACPKTHTVAVCESLGISYTKVDVQAASCQSAGYTVYECDKCGKQFADDFTEKADHNYVSNTKLAHLDKQADCKEGVTGLSHVICTVCKTATVITVLPTHKDAHKLTYIAGSGVGCAARYKCSLCGDEGYLDAKGFLVDAAAHEWEFDSVEKEPSIIDGVLTNGVAIYKCKVCKDIKKVEILSECKHYGLANNLVIDYAEPTCDEAGSVAVYQCSDCATFFVTGSNGFEELEDTNKDDVIDLSDAAIPALGHTYDETKGVKEGCEITYYCEVCETSFTVEDHNEENCIVYGDPVGVASCISKQYITMLCLDCETIVVKEEGGFDLTHETVSYTLPSNCGEVGYKGRYCLTCDEYTPTEIVLGGLVEGKDYWVVTENPDTAPVVHYYRVVERATLAKNPNAHKLIDAETGVAKEDLYIPCTGSATIRYLTCANCDDYGYELWRQSADSHTNITLGTIAHNADATRNIRIPAYTIEYKGVLYDIPQTDLQLEKKKSATIKYCLVCGTVSRSSGSQSTIKTTYFYANKAKAMEEYGYFKMSILPVGDVSFNIEEGKYVDVAALRASSTPAIKWETPVAAANCSVKGYVAFHAYEEKTNYSATRYAYITSNEHTLATNPKWVKGVAPTCDEAGSHGYYVCSKCGAKFAFVGGLNDTVDWELRGSFETDEQKELTSLVLNKHSDTLVPLTNDDCVVTTYWKCTECGVDFADENATAEFDSANTHAWVYAAGYQGVPATCNQDGVLQIRTCANCSKIEFNALYEANGYVNVYTVNKTEDTYLNQVADGEFNLDGKLVTMPVLRFKVSADGKVATDLSVTKVSGIIPMYNHKAPYDGFIYTYIDTTTNTYVEVICPAGKNLREVNADGYDPYDKDHAEPQFVEQICLACNAELLTNYVPATGGHVNAAGEILTHDCDNAVITDRYCVLCNADVPVDHVWSDKITVKATCVSVGYTYWYCLTEGCNVREMTGTEGSDYDEIDPDAHELVDLGFEANYGHDGQTYTQCALCGKIVDAPKTEAAPKVAGVEISLTTDFESYMPGSIVNVTVSLESLLGVDVWAVRFPVNYDPTVYQYVGCKNIANEFASLKENSVKVNETTTHATYGVDALTGNTVEAGVVNVVANASEDVYVKGSFDLVTLQFKVIATEIVPEDIEDDIFTPEDESKDATNTTFTVKGVTVTNYTKNMTHPMFNVPAADPNSAVSTKYPIEVANAKGKTVKSMYGDGENSVSPVLLSFLDLDGDTVLTLADAKILYTLITSTDAEYNVLADADADGAITPADLTALYEIFIGKSSINDILNPDTEDEKVIGQREQRYEAGVLVYDSYCDFDFNGRIEGAAEMMCFTGREDYKVIWAGMGYDVSGLN